jgi:ABC-type phosphate/phosphonate transport system substrate-binding protein
MALIQTPAIGQGFIYVGGSAESLFDTRTSEVEILITLLFNEMYKDEDEKLKIKIYDTDKVLAEQLAAGKLDATFINPILYLENIEYLNSDFTYAVKHGPTVKPKYVLLARRDSGIRSLKDLRNKRIIIPTGHIVGKRFLDVELLRSGLPVSDELFTEIRHTSESSTAIINLFFSQVDAVLVTDFSFDVASELNRQIPQALQIISTSPPLIHMLVSVRKGFPREKFEKLLPFADQLNSLPRLQYMRKTLRIEGVKKVYTEDFLELVKLNTEYLQLTDMRVRH